VDHEANLLDVVEITEQQDLPAGGFRSWLRQMQAALTGGAGSDVPCGTCNACCRAGYFIHVEADETDALARIPKQLLFPAPGQPKGNMLMGHDEHGRCPMLIDDACSIYAQRPRACRTYDCRVYGASGVVPEDSAAAAVRHRSLRWRFDYDDERDRVRHAALRAAAQFLRRHPECVGGSTANATQLALSALKVHDVFLKFHAEHAATGRAPSEADIVAAVKAANSLDRST
jgi:uncharacterized protein